MKNVLLCLLALAILIGCDEQRGSPPGTGGITAGASLVSIGHWCQLAGCALVGAGTLALVASFFPWTAFLAVFRPLISEVIALGTVAVLIGSSFVWLGTHAWLMGIVVGLLLVGLGVRYRVRLARFLGFPRKATTPKVANG